MRKRVSNIEPDENQLQLEDRIDHFIDVQEVNEVFRLAIKITAEHYTELGQLEKFIAYKDVKAGLRPPSVSMSEWEMRMIKSEVASYIRNKALWQAALTVSDSLFATFFSTKA